VELISEKNRVKFKTICLSQEHKIVLDGVAWVMPPKRE
jgi:3-hydroxybutyryl-CoA dehydratase